MVVKERTDYQMNRRPLHFITREKEWELINKLLTVVDVRDKTPQNTAIIMASPDYSATVAMHLAHAWSRDGEMLPIIPVDVTYPGETNDYYIAKFQHEFEWWTAANFTPTNLILVEAGIIRGGNWTWLLDTLMKEHNYTREQLTLVALCENISSKVKSDYVGEYYDDSKEELMFYFERYNKHWPIF